MQGLAEAAMIHPERSPHLAVVGALVATVLSGAAQAADLPIRLTVKSTSAEPTYITNQSLSIVRTLADKPGKDVEGVTHTRFRSSFEAQFHLAGAERSWCVTDVEVLVRVGYQEISVYIPREFPSGSCHYSAVLAHEQKHVDASRAILKELTPQVTGLISEAVRRKGPRFCGATQAIAQDAAMAALRQGLNRVNERQDTMHERAQAAIDTPEEYRRVGRLCPNWPHR